jgi:signal transduction histidine kinase
VERASTRTPLLVGALVLLATGLVVEVLVGATNPFLPLIVTLSVLHAGLGTAVAQRRPGHPVGVVLLASAAVGATVVATGAHVDAALAGAVPTTGLAWSLWVNRWLWVLMAATPTALLLAFPGGRLPSPRWRPVLPVCAAGVALFVAQSMGQPFAETFWRAVPATNPLGDAAAHVSAALGPWPRVAFVLASGCGAAAVLGRLPGASEELRGRLLWVAVPGVFLPVALALSLVGGWEWAGAVEMVAGLAVSVTVAVVTFRHRMFDVDVALNRAVVYGLLMACLAGAYVAVVVVVSAAVEQVSWLPGVAGAAVVAVSFGPLLHLLQRAADELLFGARRSPERVVGRILRESGLGAASAHPAGSPEHTRETLGRAAAALRSSLRLPWVRLECAGISVTRGEPRTAGECFPLRRGTRSVGVLEVGRRYDGERVSGDDPALASAVAQLALTMDALLGAAELRHARDRMATARADERRRVHRDLHDGLGPTLAGVCLGLEGAEQLAGSDPAAAVASLPELRVHARQAVDDLRRLVDGLRPAELDELGLLDALRFRLGALAGHGGAQVRLRAPRELPGLPEQVELAAFRICLEAVTNVVRHAAARTCEVSLEPAGDRLLLEIRDDGRGLGKATPHVGLRSMHERAHEAGGRLEIEAGERGGTRVLASLPLEGPA